MDHRVYNFIVPFQMQDVAGVKKLTVCVVKRPQLKICDGMGVGSVYVNKIDHKKLIQYKSNTKDLKNLECRGCKWAGIRRLQFHENKSSGRPKIFLQNVYLDKEKLRISYHLKFHEHILFVIITTVFKSSSLKWTQIKYSLSLRVCTRKAREVIHMEPAQQQL